MKYAIHFEVIAKYDDTIVVEAYSPSEAKFVAEHELRANYKFDLNKTDIVKDIYQVEEAHHNEKVTYE